MTINLTDAAPTPPAPHQSTQRKHETAHPAPTAATTRQDSTTIFCLIGPLTQAQASDLAERLSTAIRGAGPGRHIRLDLSGCTNLDLAGADALDQSRRDAELHGVTLYLSNVPPLLARTIDRQHSRLLHPSWV